jgi:hypothetical protein
LRDRRVVPVVAGEEHNGARPDAAPCIAVDRRGIDDVLHDARDIAASTLAFSAGSTRIAVKQLDARNQGKSPGRRR